MFWRLGAIGVLTFILILFGSIQIFSKQVDLAAEQDPPEEENDTADEMTEAEVAENIPPEKRVEPEPAPKPEPSAGADVEVLEFVDEVVEVRKRPAEPAPSRAPRGATGPAKSVGGGAGHRPHGVLQFQDKSQGKAGRKGLLGDDLQQMSSAKRAGLVVLALAVAAGLGYAAMQLVG